MSIEAKSCSICVKRRAVDAQAVWGCEVWAVNELTHLAPLFFDAHGMHKVLDLDPLDPAGIVNVEGIKPHQKLLVARQRTGQ